MNIRDTMDGPEENSQSNNPLPELETPLTPQDLEEASLINDEDEIYISVADNISEVRSIQKSIHLSIDEALNQPVTETSECNGEQFTVDGDTMYKAYIFDNGNAQTCLQQHDVDYRDLGGRPVCEDFDVFNSMNMDILPDEVFQQIFSMFPLTELCCRLSLVCKRWYGLVMDPIHWQKLNVGHLSSESLFLCLDRATLLKTLDLGSRKVLRLDETVAFAQNCHLLQELHLSFCDTLSNELLKVVADNCKNLQKLNVEGSRSVDNDSLRLLSKLPKLSHVNLSHCTFIQTEGMCFFARNMTRLIELDIDGIPDIRDSAIEAIEIYHGAHLERLSVDGAELTDAAIKCITKFAVLVELKVSFAELFTDVGLAHLQTLKGLRSLKIRRSYGFSSDCLLELFMSGSLQFLQSLDLSECVQLLDNGIEALVKCCGKTLRILRLCWCWNISDDGLEAIICGCPYLEKLELVGLDKINGNSLEYIPAKMPHLRRLDLQQCNQIIDDLVESVVREVPHLVVYNYFGERVTHELNSMDTDEFSYGGDMH